MRSSTKRGALLLALTLVALPVAPATADDLVDEPTSATTPEPDNTEPPAPAPTEAPEPTAAPEPGKEDAEIPAKPAARTLPSITQHAAEADEPSVVENAELRWGMTNEANNSAFLGGTYNFFSAGKVGNPGSGGNELTAASSGGRWSNGKAAGWSAESGNVTIEKFAGSAYTSATWLGLSTDSNGAPLGSPLSGTFSNHQIVFGEGAGTLDAETDNALITWQGDATVLFYSGRSFFYLSDPVLDVKDGAGKITATLGGFGSSQNDADVWAALPSRTVTIADLGTIDLDETGGFTAQPRYLGVSVTGVAQAGTPASFGSFPQSFIDFQVAAGAAGFWHSSGGSADPFKKALPLTVSYDATKPVTPPPPPPGPGAPVTVDNPVLNPPVLPPVSNLLTSAANLPPSATALPGVADAAGETVDFQAALQATTIHAAPKALLKSEPAGTGWWWLGGSFLLMAALTLAAPALLSGRTSP